jgi:glucan phosphoethanolaminetransferase (alkaline phosphatase superfamily)
MFLAIVCGVLIFFFPIAVYFGETSLFKYFLHMVKDIAPQPFPDMKSPNIVFGGIYTLPLSILQVVIIGLLFITIFKYRNRIYQMKLNRLVIFLNVILTGGIFFFAYQIENSTGVKASYGAGAIFPLIAIVLIFLANSFIKKDEKLVRSADRLR